MRAPRSRPLFLVGVAAALLLPALAATASASPTADHVSVSGPVQSALVRVCPAPPSGYASCHAIRNDRVSSSAVNPSGYHPYDLQSAYGLGSAITAFSSATATVAIVDAYDDPNAESDLGSYRLQFNLPPCTTSNACFKKINQVGGSKYPHANSGWAQEISLDLDMVSAICPQCKILLVEASTNSYSNLGAAVNTAAATTGVVAVSNSYGGGESSGESSYDTYYNHPKVSITASSGDNGYGVEYPAASPYVTAVGGTSLTLSPSRSETAWSGAGSGCSQYEPKPSWQKDACGNRTVADVSAVADPNTGVAVYDTYGSGTGWMVFGGTSVASPIIASVYALAGNGAGVGYPYSHLTALNDVTSGSTKNCNGTYLCVAGPGYDGPTGLGTPNGTGAF